MDTDTVNAALDASPAARITPERIEAVITGKAFHKLTDTLTVCVLTLVNGFTATGESACASPANYRQDVGEHFAYEDAKKKVWTLEAYLLKQRIAEDSIVVGCAQGAPRQEYDYQKREAFQSAMHTLGREASLSEVTEWANAVVEYSKIAD